MARIRRVRGTSRASEYGDGARPVWYTLRHTVAKNGGGGGDVSVAHAGTASNAPAHVFNWRWV
jgi:hypothetical protein